MRDDTHLHDSSHAGWIVFILFIIIIGLLLI